VFGISPPPIADRSRHNLHISNLLTLKDTLVSLYVHPGWSSAVAQLRSDALDGPRVHTSGVHGSQIATIEDLAFQFHTTLC
jgi:hypothetical protein